MAGKIESITSSPDTPCSSSSEFYWPTNPNQSPFPIIRSKSDQQPLTPISSRQWDNQSYDNWCTALRCKQNVGTQEWINCKQTPCVKLREELHHLLVCRYRCVGGCEHRCMHLRQELQYCRELLPKHPTVKEEHLKTRQVLENEALQKKIQALTIENYVTHSSYSPTSPNVQEPFLKRGQKNEQESDYWEHVVELIPLDERKLSLSNGCFRKNVEWKKINFLGRGTFGSTFLCYDLLRQSHFAIKKVPKASFQKEEVNIWQKLSGKHPNILELYGAIERKERVLIFMEYMIGGSVADYLGNYGAVTEKVALLILQQVLEGLNFMHRSRILHGDIKAANVLMDDMCLHIKLADFGSCVDLTSLETLSVQSSSLNGTLAFMAPEVCRSEAPSPSSDIWSAMCLLIQMLSAEAPWEEYRHQGEGCLLFVIGSARRPPRLPKCSKLVQEIFANGLNVIATLRPTAAELLRHKVFKLEEDYEVKSSSEDLNDDLDDEADLDSDDSGEYLSSHSSRFDTSGEYFSSEDCVDEPSSSNNIKAKSPNLRNAKAKHVDSKGAELKITNGHLTIPSEALRADTKVSISSISPIEFYQTIIDNDIQDKVTIVGDIYKLRPSGLHFRENVTVRVTLPEELHQSEDIVVFHGSFNEETKKLVWESIEKELLPFKNSTVVRLNIRHFSKLLFVKRRIDFATEFLATYLNFQPALFRFIVLVRRDDNQRGEICVVVVRDSFYIHCEEEMFRDYCLCCKLKKEGYTEMFGSRREYISLKENIQISIEDFTNNRACSSKQHMVLNEFAGEKVAMWPLDSIPTALLSGTVVIKRTAGQKYRFQFWQHDSMEYVQTFLNLTNLNNVNMLPVARALDLSQEEINEVVENTGGNEDKQLEEITNIWHAKAENNELPSLDEFLASVPDHAILLSDRGKSHISHLSEFSQKWKPNCQESMYLKTMARNGEDLCQSVFSDYLLQADHSKNSVRFVSNGGNFMVSRIMKKVMTILETGGDYPARLTEKLAVLIQAFESYDQDKNDISNCRRFCEDLFLFNPWLIQIVKDCFKIHPMTEPTGMWGLTHETADFGANLEEMKCFEVLTRISDLLRNLCEKNSTTDDIQQLNDWNQTLSLNCFLEKLSIPHKEWLSLAARVRYYHMLLRCMDKISNDKIHTYDLRNLLRCLRKYVTFCPTRLVHFRFSIEEVEKLSLGFDECSNTFTQKCKVSMANSALYFSVVIDVCIKGNKLGSEVDIPLQRCVEQDDDNHGECTTLTLEYHHKENDEGMVKICNDCQNVSLEHSVRVVVDETDVNSNVLIKEGCPDEKVLNEIAAEVTKEWKQLGHKLLSNNEVGIIDADERLVVEKTIAMLVKWKQINTTDATYRALYDALVFVKRKDIAEKHCIVCTSSPTSI